MLNEAFGLMRGVDAVVKSAPQAILQARSDASRLLAPPHTRSTIRLLSPPHLRRSSAQVYVMLVTRGFTYLNMSAIAFALLSCVFMFIEYESLGH